MERRQQKLATIASSLAGLAVLLLAAGDLGCAGSSRGGSAAGSASARSGVLRLLEHLDGATIESPELGTMTRGRAGSLGPAPADAILLRETFDDTASWPGPWFGERVLATAVEDPAAAARLPRIACAPEQVGGAGVVRLRGRDSSLVALVPARAEESWLVRARMKAVRAAEAAAATDAGGIAYLTLRFDPPPLERLLAEAPQLAEQLGARPQVRRLEREDGAPDAGESRWQELRLVARPYPERKALAIALRAGDGEVLVDEVEVRRLSPLESLALTPDDSAEPASHALRRRVAIDLETWDCLALPAPGSARFTVDVPAGKARLEFASAALTDGAAAPFQFRVTIEGGAGVRARRVLHTGNRAVAPGARSLPFELATVDLASFAGRRVELVLSADGPAGSVALFGAPVILGTPAVRGETPATNLLLISLDTLRADHVGCYGAKDARTPRIDRLANEGVRFARVISPASYTLPTHVTMMSGQDPLVHETVKSTQPIDPARTAMLAERLRGAGYRTAAFTGGALVHPRYGFGVGFDSYSIRDPSGVVGLHRRIGDEADRDAGPGEDRMGVVVDWLERSAETPFFLFVHTYLVHNYRPAQQDLDALGGGKRPTLEEFDAVRKAAAKGERAAIERLHVLYRGTVAQADREIVGRLLDALERLGLDERTLVVLTSDHGEEFHEHAMIGHAKELWHTLTHVPWIVRGPGVPRDSNDEPGIVRDDPVSLADVAPTVAGRLGLDPDPRVLGLDQFATDPEENRGESRLLSMRSPGQVEQDALLLWPWKLIRTRTEERPWPVQLYRLDEDPLETRDLASSDPTRTAGLTRLLDARQREQLDLARSLPSSSGEREFDLPIELERLLDQLGYAEAHDH